MIKQHSVIIYLEGKHVGRASVWADVDAPPLQIAAEAMHSITVQVGDDLYSQDDVDHYGA